MLTNNAEGEISDKIDDSMEDNTYITDPGSSKALSPKTLPFDDDKGVMNVLLSAGKVSSMDQANYLSESNVKDINQIGAKASFHHIE
ncbi:hypothetical protein KIN20_004024 [Parelaphostrongylus tenuis]|uniref:Uncharacterized protein n=1 Tax=Parelaphostrongylus tenuis TaxID=148309 RepID=A0AAD5QJ02_PARTN|nr:hypothetical protein KIN20_004024 [Parelaphostrongylus tenuis]